MKINRSFLAPLSSALLIAALLPGCVTSYPDAGASASVTYRTGYEVRTLPPGYRVETIGGTRYYQSNGTYYRSRSGRYVVVDPPGNGRRDREVYIKKLPSGHRMVPYRGKTYYQVQNTYYVQRGGGYVIVAKPY